MVNWNSIYDDCYFTPGEGMAESHYIFFDGNNLGTRLVCELNEQDSKFSIVEAGFGTGLNVYLASAIACEMSLVGSLCFYSVEKHPLEPTKLQHILHSALSSRSKNLYYYPKLNKVMNFPRAETLKDENTIVERIACFAMKYTAPKPGWNANILYEDINFCIKLELYIGDILEYLEELRNKGVAADALFLDGHSPRKNSDMWTTAVFNRLSQCLNPGATFSTFTAAGTVRRGLANAGFQVMLRAGYGKKRHCVYGIYA